MATYKLPEGQKLATFKVDESDWEAFKTLCEDNGSNASRVLINFIKGTLASGTLGAELTVKTSSQGTGINIDELEARLMARLEARLTDKFEGVLAGK